MLRISDAVLAITFGWFEPLEIFYRASAGLLLNRTGHQPLFVYALKGFGNRVSRLKPGWDKSYLTPPPPEGGGKQLQLANRWTAFTLRGFGAVTATDIFQ